MGLVDCVQVEVHSLEKYLSNSKEKILKEVSRSRIIENNKYGRSKEEIHKEHREKYEVKPPSWTVLKSYRGSKRQKVMGLVEGGLLKERN